MWRIFLISIILLSLLNCSAEERIVIGAVLPLTGEAAEYGLSAQRGIDLAVKEVNQRAFLNGKLVVVYADSRCDSFIATREAQNLIAANGLRIVIGDLCTESTSALADVARQNTAVVITPAHHGEVFSITPSGIDARDLSRGTPVFQELYRRVYGEDPDVFAAQSYDAVKAAAEALKDHRTARDIRTFLQNYTVDGMSGRINFGG